VNDGYLAIVNPHAAGGRCRDLFAPVLDRLKGAGVRIEVAETKARAHASELARDAYRRGWRQFIAVGGDGTSYEIVNGLFPDAVGAEPPVLGFLPLGTGNSFLRDFTKGGVEGAMEALIAGRRHPCDVMRMRHRHGVAYYINLLSVGFAADVNEMRSHRFARYGTTGYFLSIFTQLVKLHRRPFPVRVNEQGDFDRRPCLFLTFNNSKFTGGTMMIAPDARVDDGLIEYVRWGPIGRLGLIRNLSTLYDGTHTKHPLAERQGVRRVDFDLSGKVDVMVDGEAESWHCETLDVLPSALRVVV